MPHSNLCRKADKILPRREEKRENEAYVIQDSLIQAGVFNHDKIYYKRSYYIIIYLFGKCEQKL